MNWCCSPVHHMKWNRQWHPQGGAWMVTTKHWGTNQINQRHQEASNKTHLVYFSSVTLACLIDIKEHISRILISVIHEDNDHLLVGWWKCLEIVSCSSGPVCNSIVCFEIKGDWDWMKATCKKIILQGSADHNDMCLDLDINSIEVQEQHGQTEYLDCCAYLKAALDL